MKKIIVLLSLVFPAMLFAQSVSINTDASAPHGSAILDIKSDSKGLLTPRLTTSQRTAIAGPAVGLTVFDITTYSFWMYRGDLNGGWAELQHNFQNYWGTNGTNLYNTNTGNVGIGTNAPTEKFVINGSNPVFQFMNSGTAKGYLQSSSNDIKLGTYANNSTGNLIFSTKAIDRMWLNENGQLGIGTSSPSTALTINGTNPVLQLRNADVNKGFVQLNGDDVRIGTNSTNTVGNLLLQTKSLDRVTIDENGQVGIGTTSPTSILSINASNPILQLKNNGVDKGFIQLVGSDVKIGTNLANSTGSFIIRTGGADRVTIDDFGRVHFSDNSIDHEVEISTTSPTLNFSGSNGGTSSIGYSNSTQEFTIQKTNVGGGNLVLKAGGNLSTTALRISTSGLMSFGTGLFPATYKFSVEGKIIATDFVTLPVGSWPDYVFSKDYELKPLTEVKKFIDQNKHLPNIPAAAQIEKEGIQLGDMSKRLMEKVEELTLYILQQQDQIDDLKKQITSKKEN